jgi:hypothetical protein
MNTRTFAAAVDAAQRFLAAAAAVEQELATTTAANDHPYEGAVYWMGGSKATGDLRRKSLDLTRALADLRRPS